MPNADVVGTILPEGDPMTRLGLLLRDGLPEDPMEVEEIARDNRVNEPEAGQGTGEEPPKTNTRPLYLGVVPMPPPKDWLDDVNDFRNGAALVDKDRYASWYRRHEEVANATGTYLEPIEYLLAYRRLLCQRHDPLEVMHKYGGMWDDIRRAIRGRIATDIRKNPKQWGLSSNPSNEAVTDAACADVRYMHAVRLARQEATEHEALSKELKELEIRIEARKVANLQYNREAGLQ